MSFTKPIAGLIPGFMALGLVGQSVKTVPKSWGPKGVQKVDSKKMIGNFTGIMIGVPMISATAGMVSRL